MRSLRSYFSLAGVSRSDECWRFFSGLVQDCEPAPRAHDSIAAGEDDGDERHARPAYELQGRKFYQRCWQLNGVSGHITSKSCCREWRNPDQIIEVMIFSIAGSKSLVSQALRAISLRSCHPFG